MMTMKMAKDTVRYSRMEYDIQRLDVAMSMVTISTCMSISRTSHALGLDERYHKNIKQKRNKSTQSFCIYRNSVYCMCKRMSKSNTRRWIQTNNWLGTEKHGTLRIAKRYYPMDTRGCSKICRTRGEEMKYL